MKEQPLSGTYSSHSKVAGVTSGQRHVWVLDNSTSCHKRHCKTTCHRGYRGLNADSTKWCVSVLLPRICEYCLLQHKMGLSEHSWIKKNLSWIRQVVSKCNLGYLPPPPPNLTYPYTEGWGRFKDRPRGKPWADRTEMQPQTKECQQQPQVERGKAQIHSPQGPAKGVWPASIIYVSAFWPPELWDNELCGVKPPSVWWFVTGGGWKARNNNPTCCPTNIQEQHCLLGDICPLGSDQPWSAQ